jgi:hypothetical protein
VSAPAPTPSLVRRLVPPGLGVALLSAIGWGWTVREERYVTPDTGLGYWLGLAGLACMIALLFYSVRKRALWLRSAGSLRDWLSVHMLLGLVGPLFVLFHANFRLGSLNSNVSLACVLLVASSGVIGRLLYPRVHHELTGRRATLAEVRAATESRRASLRDATAHEPALFQELAAIDELAARPGGPARLLVRMLVLRRRARTVRRRYPALWEADPGRQPGGLADYVSAVGGFLSFRACERMFALWHSFHLPFCVVLFAAAAVHVLAVHLY